MPVVEQADHQLKFNPLANWTKQELEAYAAEHELPAHPLVAQGFPSIGCWPCALPVEDGQDERSSRWAGSEKDRMRNPYGARARRDRKRWRRHLTPHQRMSTSR